MLKDESEKNNEIFNGVNGHGRELNSVILRFVDEYVCIDLCSNAA